MISIVIGTTPTLTLQFTDIDLSQASHILFTLKQNDTIVAEKTEEDITVSQDGHSAEVYLDQNDTLNLKFFGQSDRKTLASVMLNWTYADGSRGASTEEQVEVLNNLHLAVIS